MAIFYLKIIQIYHEFSIYRFIYMNKLDFILLCIQSVAFVLTKFQIRALSLLLLIF